MNKDFCVYLLLNKLNNRTYLGIIDKNKLDINILLHNAKNNICNYTKKFKDNGEWRYYLIVKNLYKYEALNIERLVSNRRLGNKTLSILEQRVNKLKTILSLYPKSELIYYNND